MTGLQEAQVWSAASTASSIASLCELMSTALGGVPETSIAAEAVEGLSEMARMLSNDLRALAKGEPA